MTQFVQRAIVVNKSHARQSVSPVLEFFEQVFFLGLVGTKRQSDTFELLDLGSGFRCAPSENIARGLSCIRLSIQTFDEQSVMRGKMVEIQKPSCQTIDVGSTQRLRRVRTDIRAPVKQEKRKDAGLRIIGIAAQCKPEGSDLHFAAMSGMNVFKKSDPDERFCKQIENSVCREFF